VGEVKLALALIIALLSAAASVSAAEWRGIVPLQSTREDVKRQLGRPKVETSNAFYYRLSRELAVVHFQPAITCEESCGFGWNVRPGTVVGIGVIPTVKARSNLEAGFVIERTKEGFEYHSDASSGLHLEKYKGHITLVTYSAASTDQNLECRSVRDCIRHRFPQFDEFGDISFSEVRARVDNFVMRLRNSMARGAFIIYGKTALVRKGLLKRAERARNYLFRVRGFEPQRLLIVDGGYRASASTELHVYGMGDGPSKIWVNPEAESR
jgi:hypothetical protein